jgi:hypothetical protein
MKPCVSPKACRANPVTHDAPATNPAARKPNQESNAAVSLGRSAPYRWRSALSARAPGTVFPTRSLRISLLYNVSNHDPFSAIAGLLNEQAAS